jgi:hypothetical protein
MNYEKDISIDENALDIEWLEQPSLVFKYSQWSAKCKLEVDRASEKLNIIKAELDQKVREDPEKYGVSKVTENAISNAIISHSKYQDAKADYLDKKYEAEMAQAAVWALNDKKAALENLVRLNGQNYFAGPSVPRDLSKEWIKKAEQRKVNSSIRITTKLSERKEADEDENVIEEKPVRRKFTKK